MEPEVTRGLDIRFVATLDDVVSAAFDAAAMEKVRFSGAASCASVSIPAACAEARALGKQRHTAMRGATACSPLSLSLLILAYSLTRSLAHN